MQTTSIATCSCTGSVIDHGAHVMEWQPTGHAPVLFTSAAAVFAEDTAIRGGVPICFPWFGSGREPGAPYGHGFARISIWQLVGDETSAEARRLTYRLSHIDATDPYWTHEYWAILTATFGAELAISLAVTNLDDQAFSYEAALHTYLAVDDIRQTRVTGLDGVSYVDKTTGGTTRQQDGDLLFDGETDNVYATPGPVTVLDSAGGREITVTTSGATHIIVWNPGVEKAAGIPDLGEGDWERFVCVEAGRVFDGAVVLPPGETHTLSTTIRI